MHRLAPLAALLSALLVGCSSGSSPSTPPDAGAMGSTTLPVAAPPPADAAADASGDASTDAGVDPDGGASADGGARAPRFSPAHQACCAPRADKHAALEADCLSGKAEKCADAAADYKVGCGAPLDAERASALADKGCALGHEPTCAAQLAEGISQDTDNATLRNLCAKTKVTGCYHLAGSISAYGSPQHRLNMYKLACTGGDARGCFALAEEQADLASRATLPPPSHEDTLALFVRGCTLDAWQCHEEVVAHRTRDWAKPENKDILPAILPLLLSGHEKKCESECDCRNGDVGVWAASVSAERARAYAEKACSISGDCEPLADLLERGVGGPVDLARALSIYEPLCPKRASACDRLAAMAEEGRGKEKSPEAARAYAEQACPLVKGFEYPSANILPQNDIPGPLVPCTRVARYREEGFGGPKDPKGAYQVYYYYCGTAEGVGLCKKRITLGRSLGYP